VGFAAAVAGDIVELRMGEQSDKTIVDDVGFADTVLSPAGRDNFGGPLDG
jgi:hypothetical protein